MQHTPQLQLKFTSTVLWQNYAVGISASDFSNGNDDCDMHLIVFGLVVGN